jgi:hypothetical protein
VQEQDVDQLPGAFGVAVDLARRCPERVCASVKAPDSRARASAVEPGRAPGFVDVYALSRRFSKTELLDLAREVDSGFDMRVFLDMLRQLGRYGDVDLGLGLGLGDVDIDALRTFFLQWITELEAR